MKDLIWVFRSFGFIAGILFIRDSIVRWVRRRLNGISRKRFPIRFEDLTDHDAQMTAWIAGLPNWENLSREELNKAWNEFVHGKVFH